MTRSVSRPDMTDCIVSSCPGRSSVQPKAARAVLRSAVEASRRGTRGAVPTPASQDAVAAPESPVAPGSAVAIGEHAVHLVGARTPGPTRCHAFAQRLGVLQLLEERITSPQALTVGPVHVQAVPTNT